MLKAIVLLFFFSSHQKKIDPVSGHLIENYTLSSVAEPNRNGTKNSGWTNDEREKLMTTEVVPDDNIIAPLAEHKHRSYLQQKESSEEESKQSSDEECSEDSEENKKESTVRSMPASNDKEEKEEDDDDDDTDSCDETEKDNKEERVIAKKVILDIKGKKDTPYNPDAQEKLPDINQRSFMFKPFPTEHDNKNTYAKLAYEDDSNEDSNSENGVSSQLSKIKTKEHEEDVTKSKSISNPSAPSNSYDRNFLKSRLQSNPNIFSTK